MKRGVPLSLDERMKIISMLKVGHTQVRIAAEVSCSQSTVFRINKRYKKEISQ